MSFLNQLSDDQRTNIVSLPYRVGLWVSESDSAGGDQADAQELQALSNILNGFAHEVFGSESVQHIISETVDKQNEWDGWGKNLGNMEEDCRVAIDVLYAAVDEKEVSAFKQHLIEVAEAVALAFREYDPNQSFASRLPVYISYYTGMIKASIRKQPYKSLEQFLNISASERKTLGALAQALGMRYI